MENIMFISFAALVLISTAFVLRWIFKDEGRAEALQGFGLKGIVVVFGIVGSLWCIPGSMVLERYQLYKDFHTHTIYVHGKPAKTFSEVYQHKYGFSGFGNPLTKENRIQYYENLIDDYMTLGKDNKYYKWQIEDCKKKIAVIKAEK